ncbi:cell division inhibitor [Roseivirga seohaensis subsp. aquiponti]|uniref:Cell division inhibitor n=1 Tax=Roseivirga seohaensis subsp. aquiponti TaxID=1566026 RepID=A0A0L8AHZ3_9BACT|nr:TIGR01777 family oxidoreductase [Roseivirga seohaensis]KOF01891.1 cell division inhibitor [Roseivirga seohaensis subsp. aquiponti]
MKRIVITGGTGFLGISLAKFLKEKGFQPILVARHKPDLDFDFVQWDGVTLGDWCEVLEGASAIVNLAGRSVDCIKTPDHCDEILRSRVDSTKVIGEALKSVKNPPKVWVQMSTAHIYGDSVSQVCDENSSTGYGLAPFVGKAWEKTFLTALPNNTRGVRLRTSFVIGRNGGALTSLKSIVNLGLGGKVGNGKQGMSWIHEFDLNNLIYEVITNDKYNGFYIASAPNPVSNQKFMKELRKKMNPFIGLSLPPFMIKFGAKYIFKTDPELAIYGRYVKSRRLKDEGFAFKYPDLSQALENLFSSEEN